ncbi:unnamed protein product [Polarella glacialis]|uniref:HTTM domain-containing protein n=1 Tax=Polarella glacialis TaxID=89957 RepID=A0A813FVL5_POLGL|nr:unnamed protein product [Polarella glacialis]
MKPPFIDWWYRFTPGTLKYNAPFMPFLPHLRNLLDVLVEGPLTYGLALRCLCAPTLTAELIQPLALCGIYELFFDYGQHLSSYGTQNLHCLICMCFSEAEGQVVGMQLFLVWFYVCSGWCKIGPWFKYLNISNLMTAKFMVGRAWSSTFRRLAFHDAEASVPDFRLTRAAALFSVACALGEVAGPLLCLSNSKPVVWLGIFFICCVHLYIVATLVIDVFSWNVADAIWCTVLFGVLRTGLDWGAISSMSPWLAGWLLLHVAYVIYGHFVPDQVTYVLAHRHAAGNFCQGVLLIRKTAAWKLGKPKAHSSNVPTAAESWAEEWFGFYSLFAYLWSWNLPSKMLLPIVEDLLSTDNLEEIMLLNSVPFFEGIMGHLRFDGLSSLKLVSLLGQVCDFEEGECRLAWVGAFPSFPAQLFGTPTASWKVVDSKVGVLKEGTFDTKSLEDPEYRRPSDCHCLRGLLRERRCEDSYRPPLLLTSAFQAGAIKTGWINDTPKFRR